MMKTLVRYLFPLAMMIVIAAPVYAAPPAKSKPQTKSAPPAKSAPQAKPADDDADAASDSYDNMEVMHIFSCEMVPGITEEQIDVIAQQKLKALRLMPGAEKAEVRVLWPTAVTSLGSTDFQIVWTFPSYSDWGKFWDAYSDASPLAKSDDLTEGKVECPNSVIWESHRIQPPK
jgi:hypothetical protein